MAEDYKKAVLDRLEDAIYLYINERYVASLYMSGYVIEIGIKVEFQRLSDIQINEQNKLSNIINLLSYNNNVLQPSLNDFLKSIEKIKKSDNARMIDVILNKKSNTHDIEEFLVQLNKWKTIFGENNFIIEDYNIKKKCGWTTDLRYGKESATNNSEQEDAKNALEMAIRFLYEVIHLSLNIQDKQVIHLCESYFAEANNRISSDESEISSREQTLNNED